MMLIIGIDPGASGGIAFVDGQRSWAIKTPKTDEDIINELLTQTHDEPCHAYIEKIQPAIFGIDKGASAKLYASYQKLCLALIAAKISADPVEAKDWQRLLGIPKPKKIQTVDWKNKLKARAQQLFPGQGVTKDTADALLIAEYGRRLRAGEFSK